MKETLRALVGAAVVYVGIAACGAADGGTQSATDAGASGPPSGSGGSGSGGLLDAFAEAMGDALVHPVKDANAGPNPPLVVTEACDKTLTTSGPTRTVAVHAFPGKTVNDLAALQIVVHQNTPGLQVSTGGVTYDDQLATPFQTYLANGSAAVVCFSTTETITFILPH